MEYNKAPLEVLRETRRQLAVQMALVEAEIHRREQSRVPERDIEAVENEMGITVDAL